jgi:hypothetical protein
MSASRPTATFAAAAILAVTGITTLAACSGSLGGSATTTEPPLAIPDMCTLGQNVFRDIDELDRKKPEYLDQVKKAVKPLGERAPKDVAEDVKAWVAYVQSATNVAQLANLPADMKVSTSRIDAWWQRNCGKPLIGT